MKEITKSVIRLISIYFIIKILLGIPQLLYMYRIYDAEKYNSIRNITMLNSILPAAIIAVFCIVLWKYTDQLAEYISGRAVKHIQINSQYLLTAVISIIGLILIVQALPYIVSEIVNMIVSPSLFAGDTMGLDYNKSMLNRSIIQIVQYAVKTVLGVTLIIFSKNILGLINRKNDVAPDDMIEINDAPTAEHDQ